MKKDLKAARRPYSKPEARSYGSVQRLTRGHSGIGTDGSSGRAGKK